MAAPASKTLKDLNGKWLMNKTLSTDPEPGLALQGISWLVRKAIGAAAVTLEITEYEGPPSPVGDVPASSTAPVTHIDIQQLATGGVKGSVERRCIDFTFREHSDWLFGHVRGRSKWIATADIEDRWLTTGWLEDDAEKAGPAGETHVLSYVESIDNNWTATQIWGFMVIGGERRHARKVIIIKGDERVELVLCYDYQG